MVKTELIEAVIDKGPGRQLTKTVAGFEGAIDISQLPPGYILYP